jgi:hypothetical protein
MTDRPDPTNAVPAVGPTSGLRVRCRGWVSRAFVPERKTGHSLWHWILVIAVRFAVASLITFIALSLIGIFASQYRPIGSFNLMGFNRTDRVIYSFYVNDSWGANLFEHSGGGKATCCMSIPHGNKTVRVKWILSWNRMEEANRHAPMETYEADVPIPPIPDGRESGYFQIYFFPENKIGAAFDPLPGESDIQPQVTGTRMPDTPYVS